jgi:uncharacterized membrane protein YeiH
MTGVFGGLIRDVICREVPLVLKGELYATTCIIGGAMYLCAQFFGLGNELCMLVALLTTLGARLMAVKWHWHLPVFNKHANID